jgi:DNA polymerase
MILIMQNELAQLLDEIRENLSFVGELGVAGLETDFAKVTEKIIDTKKSVKTEETQSIKPFVPDDVFADLPKAKPASVPKTSTVSPSSLRDKLEASRLANLSASNQTNFPLYESTKTVEPEINQDLSTVSKKKVMDNSLFGDLSPVNELPPSNETLEEIRAHVGNCTRCRLSDGRTQIVHSTGNINARLMFIGEAPGADEDAKGEPFVGRAGQLLTKIIEAMGLKREDVFIGNVNRCRPPGNRAPQTDEAKICKPFLLREIAVVRPKVIVVLGNTATQNLLETKVGITKLRGEFQDYFGVKVMPTFHPAYLLRDPSKKRETWDDMKKVRDYLNQTADKK